MAMSNLPVMPFPPLVEPKHTLSSLFKDQDYKHSWQEELKRAYPFEISIQKYLDGDDKFQELVDKRCVDNVRMLILDSVQHAMTGHAGMPLGMAEIAYFLYRHAMRYNPTNPKWFNRDRFVLSAGHGALLQYVCLHLAGFQSVQIEDLQRLFKFGSRTPRHPENGVTEGIEVTTGISICQVAFIFFFSGHQTEFEQYSLKNSSEEVIQKTSMLTEALSTDPTKLLASWVSRNTFGKEHWRVVV